MGCIKFNHTCGRDKLVCGDVVVMEGTPRGSLVDKSQALSRSSFQAILAAKKTYMDHQLACCFFSKGMSGEKSRQGEHLDRFERHGGGGARATRSEKSVPTQKMREE